MLSVLSRLVVVVEAVEAGCRWRFCRLWSELEVVAGAVSFSFLLLKEATRPSTWEQAAQTNRTSASPPRETRHQSKHARSRRGAKTIKQSESSTRRQVGRSVKQCTARTAASDRGNAGAPQSGGIPPKSVKVPGANKSMRRCQRAEFRPVCPPVPQLSAGARGGRVREKHVVLWLS